MLGYLRIAVPEHCSMVFRVCYFYDSFFWVCLVIESHPDDVMSDLRLVSPFPELEQFATQYNLSVSPICVTFCLNLTLTRLLSRLSIHMCHSQSSCFNALPNGNHNTQIFQRHAMSVRHSRSSSTPNASKKRMAVGWTRSTLMKPSKVDSQL